MLRHLLAAAALSAGLAAGPTAQAQTPTPAPTPAPAPVTRNDYTDPATWLCRPGRQDACTVNQDATVIAANGHMTVERYKPARNPKFDCFYVYPTVSTDPGGNATMNIEPAETNVALAQFARFGAKCRLYAPMYRQFTLTALRGAMQGKPITADRNLGYQDVLDAWNEYLAHDNQGRGVILIGHSQGSGVLTQLIAKEIDGTAEQPKLIAAYLMGTSLQVPKGKDVGGSFKHIPLCHGAAQTGCVIAFADFRADSPPPSNSRFGKGHGDTVAACANPSALGGGSGPVDAYMNAASSPSGMPDGWTSPPRAVSTPFVKLPGLMTAACVSDEHGDYIAVTLHPSSGGRVNDIGGDVKVGGAILKDWGLHLVDANLHMGRLVQIAGDEGKAWLAKPRE
jgi:hypothetical protein